MPPRRMPVHPAQAAADARQAAKVAASRKAEVAPHELTESEVMLLPGKKVLELGNAGKLRHLGLGLPPHRSAAAPKIRASSSAKAPLTDEKLRKMSGTQISKAIDAGLVPGVAPRRRPRGR
jgi:hypothetical protein